MSEIEMFFRNLFSHSSTHPAERTLSKRSPQAFLPKLLKSKALNLFLLYELATVNFFPGNTTLLSIDPTELE